MKDNIEDQTEIPRLIGTQKYEELMYELNPIKTKKKSWNDSTSTTERKLDEQVSIEKQYELDK